MKSKRRQKILSEKRARKATMKASGTSNYAMKKAWLEKENKRRAKLNLPSIGALSGIGGDDQKESRQ